MRMSTQLIHQRSVELMLERQSSLSKTQQQLASGKRFETAAEDPTAAVTAMRLKREIAATEQYQDNAEVARSHQEAQETALASVTDVLHNVRELVVQAKNGTLNGDDHRALSVALDQRVGELLGLANTRYSDGKYLFAGLQSSTQPFARDGSGGFAYHGDQGDLSIGIGPDLRAAVTDSGAEVFFTAQASGRRDIFSIVNDAARALEEAAAGTLSAAQLDADLDRGLAELGGAMEHILLQRSRVGGRLNMIQEQTDTNEAFKLAAKKALSNAQDLDYAEAATRLQTEIVGLEAAQRSYVSIQNLSLFRLLG